MYLTWINHRGKSSTIWLVRVFYKKKNLQWSSFLNSKIACRKDNTNFGIDTDCWFNHKDLGLLLDHLEIIGAVELYPCKLWKLAPAGTLEDIYEEIVDNPRLGKLRLIDTYELVKEVIQK